MFFEIFRRHKIKQSDTVTGKNAVIIADIYIPSRHFIEEHSEKGYPYVNILELSQTDKPLEKYINDGWTYWVDWHDGSCRYHKKDVDIHTLISKIQIRFIKISDARDSRTFGFPEGERMYASYIYDIPDELSEEIARYKYENYWLDCACEYKPMNDEKLRKRILECCAGNLIDDEYNALVLLDKNRAADIGGCDNPAYLNNIHSRSYRIEMKYSEGSRKLYEKYIGRLNRR